MENTTDLQKKYQSYLAKESQHLQSSAVFESRLADLRKIITATIGKIDSNLLDELGIDIEIDLDKIVKPSDAKYIIDKLDTAFNLLEAEGNKELEGKGFV